jgi:subtilisin family serine protease
VSGVIAGVDWVTSDHVAGQPAVANMSLGGGISTALDTAVANSIVDGVTFAVAAGNSGADACNYSPARAGPALTVGATTSSDARSSFSNHGRCLDLFAPGSSITSAWSTSNTATRTVSGTSMAAPHVTGVAARLLQQSPGLVPSGVGDAILGSATTGVVTGAGAGSPNRLLYAGGGTATPGDPAPPGEPEPDPCAGLPEQYSWSLSGTGDSDYQPNGRYFAARAGTHRGCLDGPVGVDFDLYLWRWNGRSWTIVARGDGPAPDEDISYTGTAAYYMWRVDSAAGAGSYTFAMQRP